MKSIESLAFDYTDEENTVIQEQTNDRLPTTLPIDELICLFANELEDSVEYDSFEYEYLPGEIHFFRGVPQLHTCQYMINDSGMELGKVTMTRELPFKEEEMVVVERALGALSIHLTNAIEDRSKLEEIGLGTSS